MRTNQSGLSRRRGSMLIIALGVLALLSILAVTFVSLMKLELLASKNYVDGVKARLIAEGGMEEAICELKSRSGLENVSDINADWVYAGGQYWLPLEDASVKRNRLDAADWANRASFVGSLGQSYAGGNDRYKIQVIDTQSQFNLNNVFDNSFTLDPLKREVNVYTRALRSLGEAIRQTNTKAKALNIDPIKDARYPLNTPRYFGADAFLAFRQSLPGRQFNSKYQLMEILPSETHYKLLKDYVTTKSWMDPRTVVAPNEGGNDMKTFTDLTVKKPNAGELPDQRAPININLAPREVIAANLAGLCGRSIFMYFGPMVQGTAAALQQVDAGTKFANAKTRPDNTPIQEELEYGSYPVVVYFSPMGYKPARTANDPVAIEGALAIADLILQRRKSSATTGGTGSIGPFKSYADWERWVDQNITNEFLINTKDSSGGNAFPQPDTAPMFSAQTHDLMVPPGFPTPNEVRNSKRYRPWFFDCLRSMIKANANPNGRMSMLNPNSAAYLEVDKGNLIFPQDITQQRADKYVSQTCEFVFGSKGIFEIVSLGEVLGPDGKGSTDDKNPHAQAKILTVIQIFDTVTHTSQRDFERNGHPASFTASMNGFGGFGDEKGQLPGANVDRFGCVSYPFSRVYWDPRVGPLPPRPNPTDAERNRALEQGGADEGWHGHDFQGHLECSPRIRVGTTDTSVTNFGTEQFSLLFQDRKLRPQDTNTGPLSPRFWDNFLADVSNTDLNNPNLGTPWQGGDPLNMFAYPHPYRQPGNMSGSPAAITGYDSTTGSGSVEMYQKLLNPDGFYTNELRNLPLWYRASDTSSAAAGPPPSGGFQGESIPNTTNGAPPLWKGGNALATSKGGLEFWYKPDFDWYVRAKTWPQPGNDPNATFVGGATGGDAPDERFCGLINTTHCQINPNAKHWDLYNNQARPTRGMQMWITRNTLGDLRITRLYFEVVGSAGNELPWVTDIDLTSNAPDPKKKIKLKGDAGNPGYMDKATTEPAYTWPPLEFQQIPMPWKDIEYARVDCWVPGDKLKTWRAHEWHHIGVRWNDKLFPTTESQTAAGHSIEVYLDGVAVVPVWNEIGPKYDAVQNTPVGTQPGPADLTNPKTEKMPGILRLNQTGGNQGTSEQLRRPKDQIEIGGIQRPQARRGGLFKFEEDPKIPANGTLDDVRFYNGISVTARGGADRYEEYGVWTNEFDLSDRFMPGNDFITLGNIQFTAYLPTTYGAAYTAKGAGAVEVRFFVQRANTGGTGGGAAQRQTYDPALPFEGWVREFNDSQQSLSGFKLVEPTGQAVVIGRDDRLIYQVTIFPARYTSGALGGGKDRNGFAVATPVLDDVSLVYFLPTARVLLKERVWD